MCGVCWSASDATSERSVIQGVGVAETNEIYDKSHNNTKVVAWCVP